MVEDLVQRLREREGSGSAARHECAPEEERLEFEFWTPCLDTYLSVIMPTSLSLVLVRSHYAYLQLLPAVPPERAVVEAPFSRSEEGLLEPSRLDRGVEGRPAVIGPAEDTVPQFGLADEHGGEVLGKGAHLPLHALPPVA